MNLSELAQDEMQKLIMRSKTNLNDLISSHRSQSEYINDDQSMKQYFSKEYKADEGQDFDHFDNREEDMNNDNLFDVKSNTISERLDDNLLEAQSNKTSNNGFNLVDPTQNDDTYVQE